MVLYRIVHFMTEKPFIIILMGLVISITLTVWPFYSFHLPNFKDPKMGFEARRTTIGNRLRSWNLLLEMTRPSGFLSMNPSDDLPPEDYSTIIKQRKMQIRSNVSFDEDLFESQQEIATTTDDYNVHKNTNAKYIDNWPVEKKNRRKKPKKKTKITIEESKPNLKPYFCGIPSESYAHVVVTAMDGSDLFSLNSLKAMCILQQNLGSGKEYRDLCQTPDYHSSECCPVWSLPNYIAQLYNKDHCGDITEEDVFKTKKLLQTCAPEFVSQREFPDCEAESLSPCLANCTVYSIIHFLLEKSFLFSKGKEPWLRNAMIFLPIARSGAALRYYQSLNGKLAEDDVEVTAIDLGLKEILFDTLLINDTWLIGMGTASIIVCIWLYTRCLFLTVIIAMLIVLSLGLSYFFYTVVCAIEFFPFMNILTIIVALGIGSDDAFIIYQTYHTFLNENLSRSPTEIMYKVLLHSTLAIAISCITTVAAFLTSVGSKITAVACFSIFACFAVVINFVLMIALLPSAILISDQLPSLTNIDIKPIIQSITSLFNMLFSSMVFQLKFFWLCVLFILTVISSVIVLYHPTLRLPDTVEFQLFTSNHLFEQYDFVYKNKFFFENYEMPDGKFEDFAFKLPLRFVFGVVPQDNGDWLNPISQGTLELDATFNASSSESQIWLLNFCKKIRQQPFYQSTQGPLLSNCFIEPLIEWMKKKCIDPVDKSNVSPCCEEYTFPFPEQVFTTCLLKVTHSLHRTPSDLFVPGLAGPRFTRFNVPESQQPELKAFVIEYNSNVSYSASYIEMDQFFRQVDHWFQEEIKFAPSGLQNGFFISDLEFYDLQDSLRKDTLVSIYLSIVIALGVLMFTLANPYLAFLAIVTISSIVLVSLASLILLGWKLNVLESVAICLVIGLSVDHTLHYILNYKVCPDKSCRKTRVKYAMQMMTGPSIMAGITTAISGAFLVTSDVLGYVQIGTFLLIMISISWIYSNFFLLPLLLVLGPVNNFGQIHCSCGVVSQICKNGSTNINSEATSISFDQVSSSREMYDLSIDNHSSKKQTHIGSNEIYLMQPVHHRVDSIIV